MKLYTILAILGGALLMRKLLSKKIIVEGSYKVDKDVPNRLDALHSFERRKSDGFGGGMITKINTEMQKMFKSGINPDVQSIEINIDPKLYQVKWKAVLIPSKDGIAWRGLVTRGSAGAGADTRALAQIPELKKMVANSYNHQLVLDFKNQDPKIRQFFYKYQLK